MWCNFCSSLWLEKSRSGISVNTFSPRLIRPRYSSPAKTPSSRCAMLFRCTEKLYANLEIYESSATVARWGDCCRYLTLRGGTCCRRWKELAPGWNIPTSASSSTDVPRESLPFPSAESNRLAKIHGNQWSDFGWRRATRHLRSRDRNTLLDTGAKPWSSAPPQPQSALSKTLSQNGWRA